MLAAPGRHVGALAELAGAEVAALFAAIARESAALRADRGYPSVRVTWVEREVGHLTVRIEPVVAEASTVDGDGTRSHRAAFPHDRALVTGDRRDPLLRHLAGLFPAATRVDVAAAFVMSSGLDRLHDSFADLLARGGVLRLVTGDYFDVTEPLALRRLLDLDGAVDLRVFETGGAGPAFHPKAFRFELADGGQIAFVGSSNISRSALETGVEWNYRIVGRGDHRGLDAVREAFEELLAHPRVRPLTHAWIEAYERRRDPDRTLPAIPPEPAPAAVEPRPIQAEALAELAAARRAGHRRGLVVLATGLGKTWLAAFDSMRAARVLFVAHRTEILEQAIVAFRRVRPTARIGRFTGGDKDPHAELLFASIQTIARKEQLWRFPPERFDYVVVDEFHHSCADTYRRLLEHFRPDYLLGLTATPERTDGHDIRELCDGQVVYQCDLGEAIRRGELAPFAYFGVPDDVDYENIPWRSSRFDERELTNALATEARARNALEQLRRRGGRRTLAFCCSVAHARYMAGFLGSRGVRAVAVHSGPDSAPRQQALEDLEAGELEVLCCVDMFNEGVDLPLLDTVLMLRPTESVILFLQQIGRGLRLDPRKERLTIIDYVGNHRAFQLAPRAFVSALGAADPDPLVLRAAMRRFVAGELELPPGCEVTYELEAKRILAKLLRPQAREKPPDRFECAIRIEAGEPVLQLPDRSLLPGLPRGRVSLRIDGEGCIGEFASEDIVQVTRPADGANALPGLLRGWFGDAVYDPAADCGVVCEKCKKIDDGYRLAPRFESTARLAVVDDDAVELDAHFRVERVAGELAIAFESRGGTSGSSKAWNADYNRGLAVVLQRLAKLSAAITEVQLVSRPMLDRGAAERRLELPDHPGPIRLGPDTDCIALRRALGRAQAAAGRRPGAKGGGNQTKAIRLVVRTAPGLSMQQLQRLVGLGVPQS